MAKPSNRQRSSQSDTRGSEFYPEQQRWIRWMTSIGMISFVLSILLLELRPERPVHWGIEMTIEIGSSFATVAGFSSFGVAAVAISAHKMTDRSLKKIDFVWMSFAGLGLALSLGQTFASSNEILRSEFDRQLDSYRLEMIRLTDAVLPMLCGSSGPANEPLCNALHGASVMATSVVRVPSGEQAEIICSPRATGDATIVATLARLCTTIRDTRQMKASLGQISDANATLRYGILPVWQIWLSIALGLRLAKSVVEVGWLRIGSPTNLASATVKIANPQRL